MLLWFLLINFLFQTNFRPRLGSFADIDEYVHIRSEHYGRRTRISIHMFMLKHNFYLIHEMVKYYSISQVGVPYHMQFLYNHKNDYTS